MKKLAFLLAVAAFFFAPAHGGFPQPLGAYAGKTALAGRLLSGGEADGYVTAAEFRKMVETATGWNYDLIKPPGAFDGGYITRIGAALQFGGSIVDASPAEACRFAEVFSDLSDLPCNYVDAALGLHASGIVLGGEADRYLPYEKLTRAEAALIALRCADENRRRPPVPPLPVDELITARTSGQIITVTVADPGRHEALINAYEKKDGVWLRVYKDLKGTTGEFGVAYDRKQNTRKTPAGSYGFVFAFGIKPNPGVNGGYRYRGVTDNSYWVLDGGSAYYNRWVEGNPGVDAEHLKSYGYLYSYAMVIDFNYDSPVAGDGAAIFMHVMRSDGLGTAGCVTLSEEDLLKIILWLDPLENPRIIICPEYDLDKY